MPITSSSRNLLCRLHLKVLTVVSLRRSYSSGSTAIAETPQRIQLYFYTWKCFRMLILCSHCRTTHVWQLLTERWYKFSQVLPLNNLRIKNLDKMVPVVGSHVDDLVSLKDIHEVKCSVDLVQTVGILNAITKKEDCGDQLGFVEFLRHRAE